jgi:hypothetical protein
MTEPDFSLMDYISPIQHIHLEIPGMLDEFLRTNEMFKKEARKSWSEGDPFMAFAFLDNMLHMLFVYDNFKALKEIGKYEEALLSAYVSPRVNCHHYPKGMIEFLFSTGDRDKLLAAGDPIPDQEKFKLYRGVAGKGKHRRVSGFSWTDSPSTAAWFAQRFGQEKLADPAVYTVTVGRDSILARIVERNESEYLLDLPLPKKPRRLKTMPKPRANR